MRQAMTRRGFTLIEVLVALAVFAILSALAYGTLSQTLASAEFLDASMARLQAVQQTVRRIEQDFMQLSARPVRGELGENLRPVLEIGPLLAPGAELTRAGWNNPAGLPRGNLQRVAYWLDEDTLMRRHWNVLDRTLSNEPVDVALLGDVEAVTFRFMLDNGEWTEDWPPAEQPAPLALRQRPRAVLVVIVLPGEGEISRLIEVAP